MDFPGKQFPFRYHNHGTHREIFSDCGGHGNLDILDTGETVFQKNVGGFSGTRSLKASRPTLPLNDQAVWGCHDQVLSDILSQQKCARKLISQVHHKHNPRKLEQLSTLWEDARTSQKSLEVPDFVHDVLKQYQGCHSLVEFKRNNSIYAGGCISCLPSLESNARIVSVTGEDFSTIKITEVSIDTDLILQPNSFVTVDTLSSVCELSALRLRKLDYIAVRKQTSCEIYQNSENSDTFMSTGNILFDKEEHPSSVCLSKYIPGECLVATDVGNVILWTGEVGSQKVLTDRTPRFDVNDAWCQLWFGAHPREMIVADLTAVELYDIRCANSNSVDICNLSKKSLHPYERIRQGRSLSPFHHLVATDYSLLLMDQRFPATPVLQWQHMLRNPPQYISDVKDNDTMVFLASQRPLEVSCFMFNQTKENGMQANNSPWCLSRISDFTKYFGQVTNQLAITERFNNTSLVGVSSFQIQGGIVTLQMDNFGDIFYQGYRWTQEKGDKTFAWGPGCDQFEIDDVSRDMSRRWIQSITDQYNTARSIQSKLSAKPRKTKSKHTKHLPKFKDIKLLDPHEKCSICLEQTSTDQVSADDSHQICASCLEDLETGEQIARKKKDHISSDKFDAASSGLNLLTDPSELPKQDPLSEILWTLWHEDDPDLTDLLEKRDEKILEGKKKKTQTPPEKSSQEEVDLFTFFTNSSQTVDRDQQYLYKSPAQDSDNSFDLFQSDNNSDRGTSPIQETSTANRKRQAVMEDKSNTEKRMTHDLSYLKLTEGGGTSADLEKADSALSSNVQYLIDDFDREFLSQDNVNSMNTYSSINLFSPIKSKSNSGHSVESPRKKFKFSVSGL